jgi:adenosylcobinamide-GDP ribazoletransferase
VALVADVVFTGYLHLDGLADSADGLLPPMPRQRRLDAMADPALGAFGAVTLFVVLATRLGALASTVPTPLVVGALWCGSRTAMAVIARCLPYSRPGGLATAFVDPRWETPSDAQGGHPSAAVADDERVVGADGTRRGGDATGAVVPGVVGACLVLAMAIAGRGAHGLAAVGVEIVGVVAVASLARRRIGGFTGDVLGAAGVVGETVGLLVLAAKW